MELFFSKEIFKDHLYLKIEESGHCIKVLRKVNGDVIQVLDGKGNLYKGPIEIENKNKPVKVWIQTVDYFDPVRFQSGFQLIIAPTKNTDRMEWLVEKAVEMGVKTIDFIQCEHSERTNLRLDRIEKIAIAALKQSKQYWLPHITVPTPFKNYLEALEPNKNSYIAHCANSEKTEFGSKPLAQNCRILIGPEGDFSESEITMAIEKGFQPVSLGNSRLRTETAALYACAIYRQKQGL
jgi:16S rRNA (uracil1498-N3)-methyltransferase